MKMLWASLLVCGIALANNDLERLPKSFPTTGGKAVFVDFETADYVVSYSAEKRASSVVASIKFNAPEGGFPVFDSVAPPVSVMLDGTMVSTSEVKTPSNETTVRIINKSISAGIHRAEITVPLTTLVDFRDGGVRSAFWTSDLDEREFLERYLPASFEYDQVKMTLTLVFDGMKANQRIYTNGLVAPSRSDGDRTTVKIAYPDHFNSSAIFFHTLPDSVVDEIRFSLRSIDGRIIPAVVYAQKSSWGGMGALEKLKTKATEVFQELERDYGAWPHPSLTIYNAGSGGMEYCGATMTDSWALGHEMFHSYFARGVMPANGNAGWLDEALASWRDNGYNSVTTMSGTSRMSSRPYYTRTTDYAAYSFGARFMAYLDTKLKEKGGLKPFMRYMVDEKKFSPIHVEDFIRELSAFTSVDFMPDFKKYTFGEKNNFPAEYRQTRRVHRKMSLAELKKYL